MWLIISIVTGLAGYLIGARTGYVCGRNDERERNQRSDSSQKSE